MEKTRHASRGAAQILKIGFVVIVLLVIIGGFYYFLKIQYTGSWKTYTNIRFGYTFNYPKAAFVTYIVNWEGEKYPIEEAGNSFVMEWGESTIFQVDTYSPIESGLPMPALREYNEIAALPLPQFAESIRKMQISDINPTTPNGHPSELKKITFADREAYSFTLTDNFSEGLRGWYPLNPEKHDPYNFIFIQNDDGQKLMIHYPLYSPIAQVIADSFRLTRKKIWSP